MTFSFTLHKERLKRKFTVYVVVAKSIDDTKLYVGKTGDNNDGCNPLISHCGNHFSYDKMHSQVRNYLDDNEDRDYTYIFDHFDDYPENSAEMRACIDNINEMERWLNEGDSDRNQREKRFQTTQSFRRAGLHIRSLEKKRNAFRTPERRRQIEGLVAALLGKIEEADSDLRC